MASQTNAFRQQVRETKRDGSKLVNIHCSSLSNDMYLQRS